jgi:hypothetical protein
MNAAVEPVARDRLLLSIEAIPIGVLVARRGRFRPHARLFRPCSALAGWRDSDGALLLFVLAGLVALRMAPGRAAPPGAGFGRGAGRPWAQRRALAKSYDSFQWRKLLGLGLGWFAWMLARHSLRHGRAVARQRIRGRAAWRARSSGHAFPAQ